MPRLVNILPAYRRHKASGKAVVTLNGVDHYLGVADVDDQAISVGADFEQGGKR